MKKVRQWVASSREVNSIDREAQRLLPDLAVMPKAARDVTGVTSEDCASNVRVG